MATSHKLPVVQCTQLLQTKLLQVGFQPTDYVTYFAEWKRDCKVNPIVEFTDYYFGKDGEYSRPKRNGKNILWHVHLPPKSKSAEIARWEYDLKHKARKKSNTSLIYAYDLTNGYLLIDIVWEPDGHSLTKMNTPASKEMMEGYADIAEQFITYGIVLV